MSGVYPRGCGFVQHCTMCSIFFATLDDARVMLQAVISGRWVLLDNLHLAPMEVITLLDTLVSSGTVPVAARGDTVAAHPSFRLFATVQTADGASAASQHAGGPLSTLSLDKWWPVWLPEARRSDRVAVLAGRCPSAAPLVLPVMALAEIAHVAQSPPRTAAASDAAPSATAAQLPLEAEPPPGGASGGGGRGVWDAWARAVRACVTEAGLVPGQLMLTLSKALGMHDLVKVLARIEALHAELLSHVEAQLRCARADAVTPHDVLSLSVELRCAVLAEAADVLCGFAASQVCWRSHLATGNVLIEACHCDSSARAR